MKKKRKEKNNISSWGYKLFKPILGPIYRLYYNPKIYNQNYIPALGPVIIVGNHKHVMDQCSVIVSTKRVVHYMAKREYFCGKFSWFFKISGCISVNRNGKDKEAKEQALSVLNNGGALGLFPEGTRNRTSEALLPFKYGAVSLANKTNALIVPFAIKGDYKFRSKNLVIVFGEPFKVSDMDLESANQVLKNRIEYLLKSG